MPDPQPKPPTPLKRFALQRPPLAPPGTVRINQAAPPPPNFSPWQLWGQGLLEGVVDPVRGALWGATGPEDTLAAKGAETVMAGLPLVAGVQSLMAGRGLYSRVDEALKLLPKKGAHPNKIASILKSNASSEELAYRGVPEFLASKGNATVTPNELAAHLAAHPAPLPVVKTLGEGISFDEWLQRTGHGPMTPDDTRSGLQAQLYSQYQRSQASAHPIAATRTKYGQYTLPGGENYRETLVTLPKPQKESYSSFIDKMEKKYGAGYETATLTPEEQTMQTALWNDAQQYGHTGGRPDETQFRSGHFDEPNILVHTRANERTLPTGERGRFVEEVQSDWAQKGKKEGYARDTSAELAALAKEWETVRHTAMGAEGTERAVANARLGEITDQMNALHDLAGGVPDMPFKHAWPDLGLKQQVLETAADPNASWIGFTSGQTQAARYDLSKRISRVEFDAGDRQLRAFDHHGDEVIRQTTDADHLGDYLGKEAAEKLLASTPSLHPDDQTPLYSLQGVDLQVGGEGMRHFYDQVLPKRLEKIVKPFGGTVERAPLSGRTKAEIDAEMDAILERASASEGTITERYSDEVNRQLQVLQAERNATSGAAPAWIAKLTPEMKARILKEGLPLLSLTAFLAQMGQPSKETR